MYPISKLLYFYITLPKFPHTCILFDTLTLYFYVFKTNKLSLSIIITTNVSYKEITHRHFLCFFRKLEYIKVERTSAVQTKRKIFWAWLRTFIQWSASGTIFCHCFKSHLKKKSPYIYRQLGASDCRYFVCGQRSGASFISLAEHFPREFL